MRVDGDLVCVVWVSPQSDAPKIPAEKDEGLSLVCYHLGFSLYPFVFSPSSSIQTDRCFCPVPPALPVSRGMLCGMLCFKTNSCALQISGLEVGTIACGHKAAPQHHPLQLSHPCLALQWGWETSFPRNLLLLLGFNFPLPNFISLHTVTPRHATWQHSSRYLNHSQGSQWVRLKSMPCCEVFSVCSNLSRYIGAEKKRVSCTGIFICSLMGSSAHHVCPVPAGRPQAALAVTLLH